jgi:hypothetical protein
LTATGRCRITEDQTSAASILDPWLHHDGGRGRGLRGLAAQRPVLGRDGRRAPMGSPDGPHGLTASGPAAGKRLIETSMSGPDRRSWF